MAGALAVVVIALLGLVLAGSFLANFLPSARNPETIPSGGLLQAFSAAS